MITNPREAGIKAGDVLIYDDGRPGHIGIHAEVLTVLANGLLAQFENRADTTFIAWHDREWWDYLTVQEATK